jgi:von Willebrand factor type A domain
MRVKKLPSWVNAFIAATMLLVLVVARPANAAPVPEPAWPAKCPLRVGLLLDRSASLAAGFDDVQQASQDLVDALRDHPSEVMIAGFGTTASVVHPLTNVSTKSGRSAVKKSIRDLTTFSNGSGQGGTNWEAALQIAESSELQIAVILTDGIPNVYGSPVQQAEQGDDSALVAARKVSDRLKRSGTRVVPVGIELGEGGVENLVAISGLTPGDDYFLTRVNVLRGELYQIAAKSCGVPVAALPTPEPPAFPLRNIIIGLVVGVALLVAAGLGINRIRNGMKPQTSTPVAAPPAPVRDRILRVSDLTGSVGASRTTLSEPEVDDPVSQPPAKPRSMSLDFLRRPPDGGAHDR